MHMYLSVKKPNQIKMDRTDCLYPHKIKPLCPVWSNILATAKRSKNMGYKIIDIRYRCTL